MTCDARLIALQIAIQGDLTVNVAITLLRGLWLIKHNVPLNPTTLLRTQRNVATRMILSKHAYFALEGNIQRVLENTTPCSCKETD